jgi:hypothetical protein
VKVRSLGGGDTRSGRIRHSHARAGNGNW